MLERFLSEYRLTGGTASPLSSQSNDADLRAALGGCSFESGLYRIHTASSRNEASELLGDAFPEAGSFSRRHFFVRNGDDRVLAAEAGTGEILDTGVDFGSFHDLELVDHGDQALARPWFSSWTALHPEVLPISFDACVGYRIPLFLGGADTLENLELTKMNVYWAVFGQVRAQVRRLQPGQFVGRINVVKHG
jgi:hypothetical protein